MKNKPAIQMLRSIIIVGVMVLLGYCGNVHGESAVIDQKLVQMFEALKRQSFEQFLQSATPEMKKAIKPEAFKKACLTYGPMLKEKYTKVSLGSFNKNGSVVYIYRLRFEKQSDDILALFSLKGNEVSGLVFN